MVKLLFAIASLCSPTNDDIYQRCLKVEMENKLAFREQEDKYLEEYMLDEMNFYNFEHIFNDADGESK